MKISSNKTVVAFAAEDGSRENQKKLFSIYLGLLFTIAVPVNVFSIYLVIRARNRFPKLWKILLNLPVAHLVQLLFAFPLSVISGYTENWVFGEFGIYYFGVVSGTCGYVTIFTHTLIAIERYISVIHCFKSEEILSPKRINILICILWVVAVIFAALPCFGWSSYVLEPLGNHSGPNWKQSVLTLTYMSTIICLAFFLPQVVSIVSSIKFFKEVRRIQTLAKGESEKMLKFLVVSMVLFDICWGPYATMGILTLLGKEEVGFNASNIAGGISKIATITDTILFIGLNKNIWRSLRRNVFKQNVLQVKFFQPQSQPHSPHSPP